MGEKENEGASFSPYMHMVVEDIFCIYVLGLKGSSFFLLPLTIYAYV
jgi:hypothetical protein